MRITLPQFVWIRQLQRPIECLSPCIGFFLRQNTVQDAGFCHLLTNRQCRIEGRGGTLCKISNALTAQAPQLIRIHADNVFSMKTDLSPGELKPGLGVSKRRKRNGCLTRARFPNERDNLTALDRNTDSLDDGGQFIIVVTRTDSKVIDFQQITHEIILLASLPPVAAEMSSTIMFTEMVSVAIASAGISGATEP